MNILLTRNRRSMLRFVAITLSIAGLYILFDKFETYANLKWVRPSRLFISWQENNWQLEAKRLPQVDASSRASWPKHSRLLVWDYGLRQGRAAKILDISSTYAPDDREAAERHAAELTNSVAEEWHRLTGINPVSPLLFRTIGDSIKLPRRIDKDENGMATIISHRFSAQHGHLYKMAMLIGIQEILARHSGGKFFRPNNILIGRNATLAGVPRELWYPLTLTIDQTGIPPADQAAHYSALIEKVSSYLAEKD